MYKPGTRVWEARTIRTATVVNHDDAGVWVVFDKLPSLVQVIREAGLIALDPTLRDQVDAALGDGTSHAHVSHEQMSSLMDACFDASFAHTLIKRALRDLETLYGDCVGQDWDRAVSNSKALVDHFTTALTMFRYDSSVREPNTDAITTPELPTQSESGTTNQEG